MERDAPPVHAIQTAVSCRRSSKAPRPQLIAAPYNAVFEYRRVPHHMGGALEAGGDSDSYNLPVLLPTQKSPDRRKHGPTLHSGTQHPSNSRLSRRLTHRLALPGALHPSSRLLEQWPEGTSLTSTTLMEGAQPRPLRQRPQRSLLPRPPSAGELRRAASPHRRVTPPLREAATPGADERMRAEQRQPDAHVVADEVRRRPPLSPLPAPPMALAWPSHGPPMALPWPNALAALTIRASPHPHLSTPRSPLTNSPPTTRRSQLTAHNPTPGGR